MPSNKVSVSLSKATKTAKSTFLVTLLTWWYHGSVSMELQGTEDAIDGVILAIERGRYVRIENLEIRTIPAVPEERGFHAEA